MRLNSKQICEYTGGSYLVEPIDQAELAFGISWDSRDIRKGDVYVALPGERVDGHAFIDDALRAGARMVLLTDKPENSTMLLAEEMGAALIEVSNPFSAIIDIARAWRAVLKGHVVAITGSSGKTTTKNLVRDVLKQKFSVVSTIGNQNNELGVPKTLLSAEINTQVVVVEMGMRGLGQIKELCEFVNPDMGLITNVGEGHIELLGSRENIARAKAELFCALPNGVGTAFMNRSDDFASFVVNEAQLEKRYVNLYWYDGSSEEASRSDATDEDRYGQLGAWASEVSLDKQGFPNFTLHIGSEARPCFVPLQGEHNVHNACAAASVGAALGMDIDLIVEGLEHAEPEVGRQELLSSREGALVINDSYNANPDSMRAALLMFSSIEVSGRRIAVLGDMGELGDFAEACHRGIGSLAATLPLDRLLCIGELSVHIAEAAQEAGMDSDKIVTLHTISEVLVDLEDYMLPDDAVLVKASRFMGLERVVGGLLN